MPDFLPKIVRSCPRCHRRLYQFLQRKLTKGRYEAKCANCGATFKVRPTRTELAD